jgi:hypothetical protein
MLLIAYVLIFKEYDSILFYTNPVKLVKEIIGFKYISLVTIRFQFRSNETSLWDSPRTLL